MRISEAGVAADSAQLTGLGIEPRRAVGGEWPLGLALGRLGPLIRRGVKHAGPVAGATILSLGNGRGIDRSAGGFRCQPCDLFNDIVGRGKFVHLVHPLAGSLEYPEQGPHAGAEPLRSPRESQGYPVRRSGLESRCFGLRGLGQAVTLTGPIEAPKLFRRLNA